MGDRRAARARAGPRVRRAAAVLAVLRPMPEAVAMPGRAGRGMGAGGAGVTAYEDFLARKAQLANAGGFEPDGLPEHLFPFQRSLVEWAVRQGRGALFADCGIGKTPMSLAWAEQVHRRTEIGRAHV